MSASKPVFVRDATGLVRELGFLDQFVLSQAIIVTMNGFVLTALFAPYFFEAALQSSAYGGRVVIMGTCRPEAQAKFSPFDIMRYEKDILGTHTQVASFRPAIEMLDAGFVPVDVIVTHEIPLKEIDKAFSLNRKGEAVKTVISM